jgi:hypothetical protein
VHRSAREVYLSFVCMSLSFHIHISRRQSTVLFACGPILCVVFRCILAWISIFIMRSSGINFSFMFVLFMCVLCICECHLWHVYFRKRPSKLSFVWMFSWITFISIISLDRILPLDLLWSLIYWCVLLVLVCNILSDRHDVDGGGVIWRFTFLSDVFC